ncbi:MAG: RND transporter [Rhodobacteraceae bacterium]|uniref:RND transporter n=2 Tax=Albidovulum sp. TaxID=1872424 RepID=UPI001D45406F|nr:RND transporter [Paracoccaceae bacterium]HPE25844.1 RND transporter [Albidovulum sp.]MCB2134191.1 RND transporter [Paracoccaceae bacterium]MCB2151485.1 RND transporter [Paracoccaceae bacterium]MCB2159451.1 RND transporter [Paracoccaceae bacterium]
MEFLDRIPMNIAVLAALTLGLAPFFPEPHIWEKLKMLAAGTLTRPIDIFDLLLHAAPWLVVIAKLVRMALARG